MAALALLVQALVTWGQVEVDYSAGATMNAGSGDLAPYYIMAGRGGTVTQQHSTLVHGSLTHRLDTTARLSWGAGLELWGGWASNTSYDRYEASSGVWGANEQHPARAWVQQAYAEGKYRGVFLTLGAKKTPSAWLDDDLTSGDLVRSTNARPMVGASAGFINFQNVPFTRGWLQINGELGYYKPGDNDWIENHYNRYNHFITTGWWLNYKKLHFRSNPHKPFVVTVGMQAACQFGGSRVAYVNGVAQPAIKQSSDAEAWFKALIPGHGGNEAGDATFYEGNHLGAWDILLEYRLRSGHALRAYHQVPWEDGSGIGFRNGFDGLWGVEYRNTSGDSPIVEGALLEYVDLTNQSGPIHWAPTDHEGTPITTKATGMDDYYNNYAYSGYQSRGMSIGSPFVQSAIYNLDGYPSFLHNAMRGVHVAVKGHISRCVAYRLMGSWRKSWGTLSLPLSTPVTGTALLAEAVYVKPLTASSRLQVKGQLALDHGELTGNNVGALIGVSYIGNLTLGHR